MNKRIRQALLPFAISSLLMASSVMAQNTSAAVSGQVFNAEGQPVAGAVVQIVHEPSGTTKVVTTDAQGRYDATGMRVGGPYDITVSKEGMNQSEREGVYLQLASDTDIDLVMSSSGVDAQQLATIEVTANALAQTFSPENRGISTNVSRRELDALPMPGRSIQNVARLDPRIVITDRDRGEISAIGQNSRYNAITVDSVSAGDPFGLNANGLPTLGTPISIDAIQEYNISTANYNVTTRRGVGANINAVIKSGTNDFHGSMYYAFQDADKMVGEDADGNEWLGFTQNWTGGATLGGPIIKDKLFFFASYEQSVTKSPGSSFGPEGSGASTIVQGLTQDQVDQILQLAEEKGFTTGDYTSAASSDLEDKRALFKLDWNITDNHRASLTWRQTKEYQPIINDGGDETLVMNSGYYFNDTKNESVVVHFYDDWTMNFSTEASFSYAKFHKDRGPLVGGPQPDVTVATEPFGPAVQFGTEYSSQANVLDVKTKNAYFAGTWYLGEHTVKAGFDFQSRDYYNLFLQNLYGSYIFDTIEDFANDEYYLLRLAVPAEGYTIDDVAARFTLGEWGYFIQDVWQVSPNLSVQYGLRVDVPDVNDLPAYNPCFSAPVGEAGLGDYGVCANEEAFWNPNAAMGGFGYVNNTTIDGNDVMQPRFSFNYMFDSEYMTQLRGGAGIFISNPPGVWVANPYAGSGVTVASYYINDEPRPPFSSDPFNQNVPEESTVPGSGGSQMRVDTIDPGFRLPTVWKFSLGFDRELPWWNTVFTADYEYLKVRDAVWFKNINLGDPTGILPDGRYSFYEDPNGDPYDRDNSESYNANPSYDSVTRLTNTDQGWADSLTLMLNKPFNDNWRGMIGMTYSHAFDVNPGTSSVAYSNWKYRAWYNPNEAELAVSNNSIPYRFIASATWTHNFFGDYATSVSAFLDAHSGTPYSWVFGNDINGDRRSTDLFYIPASLDDVQWAEDVTDQMKQGFWDYINNDEYLSSHKGEVASRNADRADFVTQLDLSFRQEIPGFFEGHKGEFRLDFYNFTNLLNDDWGVEERAFFPLTRELADSRGVDPETGEYIYDISGSGYLDQNGNYAPSELEPNERNRPSQRWSVLATVRYEF